MDKKNAKLIMAMLAAVLFAPAIIFGQTQQTIVLPATGAPLLVTPVAHPSAAILVTPKARPSAPALVTPTDRPSAPALVTPAFHVNAPVLVTPEDPVSPVVPSVGATNATGDNTVGATNSTAILPVIPAAITTVPQYADGDNTVTFTPAMGWNTPSTPEVHLRTVVPPAGARNGTAGTSVGATNTTATLSVTPRVITTVPQFSAPGSTVTITPANPPE